MDKFKLLDKLIEIENKMPGRATPGYKLALQAGYVMKKTTKDINIQQTVAVVYIQSIHGLKK